MLHHPRFYCARAYALDAKLFCCCFRHRADQLDVDARKPKPLVLTWLSRHAAKHALRPLEEGADDAE